MKMGTAPKRRLLVYPPVFGIFVGDGAPTYSAVSQALPL